MENVCSHQESIMSQMQLLESEEQGEQGKERTVLTHGFKKNLEIQINIRVFKSFLLYHHSYWGKRKSIPLTMLTMQNLKSKNSLPHFQ